MCSSDLAVATAITTEAVKTAGYEDAAAAAADGTAFVFMGHGTSHTAKVSYSQMQTTMETLGAHKQGRVFRWRIPGAKVQNP